MSAYTLDQVRFAYPGGGPVVSVASWEIRAGEVTALCGPNGSGKTTLLHLLALLRQPTGGCLRFFGERVTEKNLATLRRQVSLVLQNPYLFRGTVQRNVEWGLRVRGHRTALRRRVALEALDRVGLSPLAGRPAADLSGGERQRVALARVLALAPRVICLDEPTNHLDDEGRERLEQVLREWVSEQTVNLVLASHDPGLAQRLGARVWKTDGGQLSLAEPENLLWGTLRPGDGTAFEVGPVTVAVHPLPAGTRCVGISPREVLLAQQLQPSSARNQLPGHIVAMAPLGDGELLVTVDCGVSLHAVITPRSWQELQLEPGAPVVAVFKASAVRAC